MTVRFAVSAVLLRPVRYYTTCILFSAPVVRTYGNQKISRFVCGAPKTLTLWDAQIITVTHSNKIKNFSNIKLRFKIKF